MRSCWTNGDLNLHFVVEGEGRPLLLMHEIGGSLLSWDRMAGLLKSEYRLIRFDQRGAGWSEKARALYRQADLVDDAQRVLAAVGNPSPVTVVAAASACATAVALANQAPQRVAGLVLLSPGFGVEGSAKNAAIERAALVSREGMAAIVDGAMARTYPKEVRDGYFETYRARFLACDPEAFAQANLAFAETICDPEDVSAAVLLAPGVLDIRPVSAAERAMAQFRNARLAPIEAAGHVPHVQNPAEAARLVAAFSNAIDPAG